MLYGFEQNPEGHQCHDQQEIIPDLYLNDASMQKKAPDYQEADMNPTAEKEGMPGKRIFERKKGKEHGKQKKGNDQPCGKEISFSSPTHRIPPFLLLIHDTMQMEKEQ